MSRAMKTVAGFVTAAGAGTNAVAVCPGSVGTFTIDSFTNGNAYLEDLWASGAAFDFLRVRSGRLHDANQGIRLQVGTTFRRPLLSRGNGGLLYSVDNLTVEADATGAGTQLVALTYGFDDLGGTGQRIADWASIQPRIQAIMGQQVSVTSSATIGTYGAGVALNATFDNWKAGRDYALLGYTVSAGCGVICLNGPDTSGQDIGFPGDPDPFDTRDYFIERSVESGKATIPILAANNKGSTILKNADTAASTAVVVTLNLALLA